ncbi:hypothetical protein [Streptomyces sp. RTd22]|nr:hypothetical protein [Streptomyces sp. RTd22]
MAALRRAGVNDLQQAHGETNVVKGRPKGFWTTTHYEPPGEWQARP